MKSFVFLDFKRVESLGHLESQMPGLECTQADVADFGGASPWCEELNGLGGGLVVFLG